MPQLDPTWFASQIFWLAVCFTLLYVLLSRVILPPIARTVERRGDTVAGDIQAAEEAKTLAEKAKHDYEHTLAQSREMAQALMNEVMAENKKHAEETLRSLDTEVAKKVDDAHRRINARKLELMNSLTPAAAEFAAMIAEKITLRPASVEQASGKVMELLKNKGAA